jgi:hypothetical protein
LSVNVPKVERYQVRSVMLCACTCGVYAMYVIVILVDREMVK